MEEAEKMEALKKVYADIILNTAKEAASRILVSERKALRFQQELFEAKEESVNMLLRLKQIMDSKIAEAEISSLNQRRRIEELEAQIHEAEDVVRDLRTELEKVMDELEKMKNKTVKPFDEEDVKGSAASPEDASHSTLDSGPGPVLNTDMNCCFVSENASTQTGHPSGSPEESNYLDNSDLASLGMRSKKPEMYRTGCTQRIIQTESTIREDETGEETCSIAPPKDDYMDLTDKNQNGLKELLQEDRSCDKGQAVKFIRRLSSRKGRSRYRNTITTLCPKQVMKGRGRSSLSRCKTYPCTDNSVVECGGDPSRIVDEEAHKESESHLAQVSSSNVNGADAEVIKAGNVHNAAKENTLLIDDLGLTNSSQVPICKLNLETGNVPLMNSDSKDDKKCDPTQTASDRHLKYTFRRKRKKESLSNPDENGSLEKNTSKKRSGEKQSDAPEPEKSSLIMESSRDSRRLVQVARQVRLIPRSHALPPQKVLLATG